MNFGNIDVATIVLVLLIGIAVPAAIIGTIIYTIVRLVRSKRGRFQSGAEADALRERVGQLEQELDAVRGEVDHLEASQDFTNKLLEARQRAGEKRAGDGQP